MNKIKDKSELLENFKSWGGAKNGDRGPVVLGHGVTSSATSDRTGGEDHPSTCRKAAVKNLAGQVSCCRWGGIHPVFPPLHSPALLRAHH